MMKISIKYLVFSILGIAAFAYYILHTTYYIPTVFAQGVPCPVQSPYPRVKDGLISTSAISNRFSNNIGICVVDPARAAFAPFKIPTYDDLKALYFDKSKLGPTQKITLTDNRTQSSTNSPINLAAGSGGPVAWWKFDEGSGTTAADSSGNNLTGSINGAASWNAGRVGPYALNFNSFFANQYVRVLDSPFLNISGPISLTAWIIVPSADTNTNLFIVEKSGDPDGGGPIGWQGYGLYLSTGGVIRLSLYDGTGSSGEFNLLGNTNLKTDSWHFVAGTWDGTTMRVYVDDSGIPQASSAGGNPAVYNSALNIGRRESTNSLYFNGAIDDVRIYNRALSDTEIQDLYNPPPTSSPAPVSADRLYYINGNLTVNSNITVGATGVIFIDGNLTINTNLINSNTNTGLVFVVKGDVIINQSVTRVDAVIISSGRIYTAGAGCSYSSVTASQLVVNGSLIALDSNDRIALCRTLAGLGNNTTPAEVVNHQPKYLVILKDLFSDTLQKWSEIP